MDCISAFKQWWNDLMREGDSMGIRKPCAIGFTAGWHACKREAEIISTHFPPLSERTFWVVERFEDGNAKSLGYWTGHNSRDFTPNIIDAMQFCRKDDAMLAKSPWHWRDCEATEHTWITARAVVPVARTRERTAHEIENGYF